LALAVIATTASRARADVDWAKGLVTAEGIGVANRSAPTPAAARGPARRLAEEAARKKLAAQVGGLAVASGGTVDAKRKKDAGVKQAIERAVEEAFVVAADPETDGSWKVTMAVPIEALRLALAGQPRSVTAAGDAGPAVVVVMVEGAKPAIGYQVGGLAAATVFVKEKDLPAWASGAVRVKAKGLGKAGVIDAAVGDATAATLFVVVAK